jgi:hypothetical protein
MGRILIWQAKLRRWMFEKRADELAARLREIGQDSSS